MALTPRQEYVGHVQLYGTSPVWWLEKEQVAKWKSTRSHVQAAEHAHQLQVRDAILSLLWSLLSAPAVWLAAALLSNLGLFLLS